MLLIKPHSHILSPPPNKKVSSQVAFFYNWRYRTISWIARDVFLNNGHPILWGRFLFLVCDRQGFYDIVKKEVFTMLVKAGTMIAWTRRLIFLDIEKAVKGSFIIFQNSLALNGHKGPFIRIHLNSRKTCFVGNLSKIHEFFFDNIY